MSAASSLPAADRTAIALTGLVALAVAMGIGRFAFTPLLPMMLHDGTIDLAGASGLASVNYLGYLVGALACTFEPRLAARWRWRAAEAPACVRAGLLATAALTLGMAMPYPAAWPLLRFAAGVASAVVFVYCSGWCLAELGRRDAARLGGVMFAGPGVGIVATGLFASGMVQWHWRAAAGWAVFGVGAGVLAAVIWRVLRASPAAGGRATVAATPAVGRPPAPRSEVIVLAIAYGIAGFGYIITATFLPVIARASLPGSAWLDLFWPILGLGVCVGALTASRIHTTLDLRWLLAACYAVQAAGIEVGLAWPSLAGFALGSLLLGLPFTVLTFYAMQEARRLRPLHASSTIGLLTAVYGLGQIAGPLLAAELLRRSTDTAHGFTLALRIAMAALLAGAALYLVMARRWPVAPVVAAG